MIIIEREIFQLIKLSIKYTVSITRNNRILNFNCDKYNERHIKTLNLVITGENEELWISRVALRHRPRCRMNNEKKRETTVNLSNKI